MRGTHNITNEEIFSLRYQKKTFGGNIKGDAGYATLHITSS